MGLTPNIAERSPREVLEATLAQPIELGNSGYRLTMSLGENLVEDLDYTTAASLKMGIATELSNKGNVIIGEELIGNMAEIQWPELAVRHIQLTIAESNTLKISGLSGKNGTGIRRADANTVDSLKNRTTFVSAEDYPVDIIIPLKGDSLEDSITITLNKGY